MASRPVAGGPGVALVTDESPGLVTVAGALDISLCQAWSTWRAGSAAIGTLTLELRNNIFHTFQDLVLFIWLKVGNK